MARSFRARRSDDAQLQGASLNGARLQGASLGGAQLQGASLVARSFRGALWRTASGGVARTRPIFKGVFGSGELVRDDLSDAILWRNTQFDGTDLASVKTCRVRGWTPIWRRRGWVSRPWDDKALSGSPQDDGIDLCRGRFGAIALWNASDSLDCASPDPSRSPPAIHSVLARRPQPTAWRKALEDVERRRARPTPRRWRRTLKALVCLGGDDMRFTSCAAFCAEAQEKAALSHRSGSASGPSISS